jgi:acetylornithine deacetylase
MSAPSEGDSQLADSALAAAIAHLAELVAFDTESSRSNAAMIEAMRAHLVAHGFTATVLVEDVLVEDVLVEDVFLDEGGVGKAGLVASIGPAVAGGTVLSGHSDVVPVAGQVWTSDPFVLRRDGDRLHARGTADMKGFFACVLALAGEMAAAPLARPIHLCVSYDEETTCEGVRPLIDHIARELPPIGAVIVGEPTGGRVATQHKGAYGWRVAVRGVPCHSSVPQVGVSATALAARLICWLDDRQQQGMAAAEHGRFTPNASTGHAGRVTGGEAVNVLAANCEFDIEWRNMPGDDPMLLLDGFRAEAERLVAAAAVPGAQVALTVDYAVPAFAPEPGGAAEALCRRLTDQDDTIAVTYSTEAGHFQDAGMSTVLCGPGSIAQAHTADEFVEIGELRGYLGVLRQLIADHSA